jgi:molecular chaperone GrpE
MAGEFHTEPAAPARTDGAEETGTQAASPPAADEFSAAAPPHPRARGTGETSFGDAEAPGSGPAPGAPDAEAAPAPEPEPDEAARYLELARRTQADFDNFRKRMARENAAAVDRGVSKLAKELLPALDHLDLALKAASGHEDVVRGFSMVRDELVTALGRVGIEPFSPHGEAFDPSQHEAMAAQPATEDTASGTVIEVYQQGYRANGTVLRPARVVVAQ